MIVQFISEKQGALGYVHNSLGARTNANYKYLLIKLRCPNTNVINRKSIVISLQCSLVVIILYVCMLCVYCADICF